LTEYNPKNIAIYIINKLGSRRVCPKMAGITDGITTNHHEDKPREPTMGYGFLAHNRISSRE
jgi:hypothetical protein